MKTFKFILMSAITAVMMCSCSNKDVVNTVKKFAKASAANDTETMTDLYPNAKFKMIQLSAEDLDVDVDAVDDDTYKAMLNDEIEFIVKKTGESYKIESSRGLLELPADMSFAKGTGQYKEELTDAENAKRLDNKGFVMWVLGDLAKMLERKIKVVKSDYEIISHHATEWFDNAHREPICEDYTAEIRVTVQNETDTEIAANAYSVISSVYTYTYSLYYSGTQCQKTENVETKTIAPHSSMVLTYQYNGSGEYVEGSGWIDRIKSVLSFNLLNLDTSEFYQPKGTEYDEYMRNHPEYENSGSLSLNMHGMLGGDNNATFILDGQDGSYIFVGAQRQMKLFSFDGEELIVDAYINGVKFGYFKGTYKDGRYKGIFRNTQKGAALNFDFTDF